MHDRYWASRGVVLQGHIGPKAPGTMGITWSLVGALVHLLDASREWKVKSDRKQN